jgi:lycopene cyclase CruA
MIATAPTKTVPAFSVGRDACAPDLAYFRRRYPETVASFGALPRREEWLRKIWELEARHRKSWETRGGEAAIEEVIVRGTPPAGRVAEAVFDVVYVGGALALLHAAALACSHGRSALVLGSDSSAVAVGDWNLSEEELRELERACVLTHEEAEAVVVNRCRGGLVKLHDAASRVKAEPLWVTGALDVVVDGERLLALAADRLRRQRACAVVEGLRFVRAYVEQSRVTIEAEGPGGVRRFFGARLLVDAGGADSPVARQLSGERGGERVCPTVGTVARGFVRGEERGGVDFGAGEILVSTEDARDQRQLFWDGSPRNASRDEYSTRLFFYDAPNSHADKSLLALFERYFESLDSYKRRGAGWRVERPLFGYAALAQASGWRKRRRTSDECVMHLGGAGVLASRGTGARLCDLGRVARLTHLALESGAQDADALAQIAGGGPRVAEAVGLTEFMRPAPRSAPQSVNETLSALVTALAGLDERVRGELLRGRVTLGALRTLLSRTAQIYPRIFARVRERFGARGAFWWLAGIAEAGWSDRHAGAQEEGGSGQETGGRSRRREAGKKSRS